MDIRYSFTLLIALYATTLHANELEISNKEQMKNYALKQCSLDKSTDCHCIANNMSDRFNQLDWQIFIAAINKDESIKHRVSERQILDFSDKLYNAVLDCGIE